jgi:hypothetical protein
MKQHDNGNFRNSELFAAHIKDATVYLGTRVQQSQVHLLQLTIVSASEGCGEFIVRR